MTAGQDSSAEEHTGDDEPAQELHSSKSEQTGKTGSSQRQHSTVISSAEHVWQAVPKLSSRDHLGLGRIPVFWYTLNLSYNYFV